MDNLALSGSTASLHIMWLISLWLADKFPPLQVIVAAKTQQRDWNTELRRAENHEKYLKDDQKILN